MLLLRFAFFNNMLLLRFGLLILSFIQWDLSCVEWKMTPEKWPGGCIPTCSDCFVTFPSSLLKLSNSEVNAGQGWRSVIPAETKCSRLISSLLYGIHILQATVIQYKWNFLTSHVRIDLRARRSLTTTHNARGHDGKSKQLKNQSKCEKCTFCNEFEETVEHLMFACTYTGEIPQRWHSDWDWHYCHTAVHNNVTAVTTATSVTPMVVTAMAATLVCRRCKLTTVQQRWQWQHCNSTVHTSVTALWQQWSY